MRFAIVFLPIAFLVGWFVYVVFMAAAGFFGIVAIVVMFLLAGLYQVLADSISPVAALGLLVSVIGFVSLLGYLHLQKKTAATAEVARQREEQERRATENCRIAMLEEAKEEARLLAEARRRPWQDRSLSDWGRIFLG